MDPILLLAGVLTSAILGPALVAVRDAVRKLVGEEKLDGVLVRLLPPGQTRKQLSYDERITQLTSGLRSSAADAQELLHEMEEVAQQRLEAVKTVETKLLELEERERAASERLATLDKIEPAAATAIRDLVNQSFDQSLEKADKRSSRRDYLIFLAGSVLTGITFAIGLILQG